ncbi:hypothetical protein WA026_007946 [Henosepilachna vigintioctopunctata]|uniref:Uncharacterized protein n=1 Tax=Henosepilachna vigintioctopunctata TaxID=420089 RepID=A0AAW1TRH7_9CUCU
MAADSYDVTNPENGVAVQVPRKKTSKLIYFLTFVLLILIGVIVYLLFFTDSCNSEEENGKLLTLFNKGNITTEPTTTVGPKIIKTTKLPYSKTDVREQNICKSTQCLKTAADILSSMDSNIEPCENFYDYACGNMNNRERKNLDIFAPQNFFGDDTPEFLLKFGVFYESCVKHEDKFDYETRLNTSQEIISKVGAFHTHGNKKNINITEIIANLILYDAMPLFDIDIDIDSKNNRYIMKLLMPDQTSLQFGHWSLLSETRRKCLRETAAKTHSQQLNMTILYNSFLLCQKDYGDFLNLISVSLWEMKVWPNSTEEVMYKKLFDLRTFMEFEILTLFDRIPLPPNLQEQNIKRQYEEIEIRQLKRDLPIVDWVYLFKVISNSEVTDDTIIQMYNTNYFDEVFELISTAHLDKLNDALLSILTSRIYVNTVLPSHKHSRVKYCQDQSKELMPDIVNYLYKMVTKTEDLNKQNADLKIIYEVLKDRFRNELEKGSWLDKSEMASLLKKLDKIQLVMFQNNDIESERDYLEETYKDLLMTYQYQFNLFALSRFKTKKLLSLHGKAFSEKDIYRYFVDASQEDPQYFYANDFVSVPFGLTRKCVDNLPAYMVLAQVGFPIAKIIGEAFDRIGINYGINLTTESKASYKYFADWTKDMIKFTNPITNGKKDLYFDLNNDLSESDRISDNTAMRLMTESFISFENQPVLPWISQEFSREKVFFLYLTQGLCRKMDVAEMMIEAFENPVLPPQFRVKTMLSNSEEFLKTFKCHSGSGMNRLKEHFQFPYL